MSSSNLIYLDRERVARRGDKPMTGAEKLDEAQWLLDGGVHPEVVAAQLGATVAGLAKLAERHRRRELARVFGNLHQRMRYAA